ncbi:MAG TPA: peroxidase family protein [Candidatus Margulisiibacteriota bacterium]|nr:peroxidase family protein [Candidatus Margulisiibacteriota bacterium]
MHTIHRIRHAPYALCATVAFLVIAISPASTSAQTFPSEFRTFDGSNNNLAHPEWGSTGVELIRLTYADYADGVSAPAGPTRPGARAISNAVVAQPGPLPNSEKLSDFVWQWGQFLDHDLDLTGAASPAEPVDIPVPSGDQFFDPGGTGTQVIPCPRSVYKRSSTPRQQINQVTAWIDASMVYGSDDARAQALRTFRNGQLKTGRRKLLPFNVDGLPNSPSTDASLFVAGDVRCNEQNGLTAMHTLFLREHNRIARELRFLGDEQAYQAARVVVGAEIQAITYTEFLPLVLGPNPLRPYGGYNANVNPAIATEFSTAAFRFGHSMLSPMLLRLKSNGKPIRTGNLPLRSAFFNPKEIVRNGIEPLLRGLAAQQAQEPDIFIVDDVRNFLFGPPGAGGFDLAALNIQRGRDHGLPTYNEVRTAFGLPPAHSFADISSDPLVQQRLASVYSSVYDVDLWVGGLAEDHYNGGMVGELFFMIIRDQFERLRNGDRFWYETYLSPILQSTYLDNLTLAEIIRRNTNARQRLPDNVFVIQ